MLSPDDKKKQKSACDPLARRPGDGCLPQSTCVVVVVVVVGVGVVVVVVEVEVEED